MDEKPDYKKGEFVKISRGIELANRSANLEGRAGTHFLHKGELFCCTDYLQPAYMDYLEVWSDIRKAHFVLPMELVERA